MALPSAGGTNTYGQVGTGTTIGPEQCPSFGGPSVSCSTHPVQVSGELPFSAVTAFAGIAHTCGLTPGGAAYCWGANYYGEIGVAPPTGATAPIAVPGGLTFASLSTGQSDTCGTTASGAAYCWGANFGGQLGIGTTMGPQFCSSSAGTNLSYSPTPVLVSGGLSFAAALRPPASHPGLDDASLYARAAMRRATSPPRSVHARETASNASHGRATTRVTHCRDRLMFASYCRRNLEAT